MDKKRAVIIGVGSAAAIGALLYLMHRRDTSDIAVVAGDNPFLAPYYTDGKEPGDGFQSTVNVNIDTGRINGLANQYYPTFGFVAVGVTGNLPTAINNVNVIQNTAPPAAVVNRNTIVPEPVPPAPAVSGWTMTSTPSRGGSFGGIGSTW